MSWVSLTWFRSDPQHQISSSQTAPRIRGATLQSRFLLLVVNSGENLVCGLGILYCYVKYWKLKREVINPWIWWTYLLYEAEPAIIITCHNCGHGVDLRGCPQSPHQIEGTISIHSSHLNLTWIHSINMKGVFGLWMSIDPALKSIFLRRLIASRWCHQVREAQRGAQSKATNCGLYSEVA